MTSPALGASSANNDFGFKNSTPEGCIDENSTGTASYSLVGSHPTTYNFNFGGKTISGYCLERHNSSPAENDTYVVHSSDRQSFSAGTRSKLARLFNALLDPEIAFTLLRRPLKRGKRQ